MATEKKRAPTSLEETRRIRELSETANEEFKEGLHSLLNELSETKQLHKQVKHEERQQKQKQQKEAEMKRYMEEHPIVVHPKVWLRSKSVNDEFAPSASLKPVILTEAQRKYVLYADRSITSHPEGKTAWKATRAVNDFFDKTIR